MTYLSFAGHWLLGVVFAISAVSKLRGRVAFTEFVATTRNLLPSRWRALSMTVSAVVVVLEAAVPVLLSVPGWRPGGLGLAMILLAGFGAGIAAALRRGERTACRCFGVSRAPLGIRHLVRNSLLAAVAVLALVGGNSHPADAAGLVVAGAAAGVLALLVIRFDDVIGLFVPPSSTRRNRWLYWLQR
ncbi:MauE/DoxX family redox-associated membrane protein [Nonomuraea sp. NPDC049141]|uniref:MauE/DoxX family redox-associated membrane protein n=1 Tax=unclassified Nonomuraea TaxID=2593643 RepID=UPI003403C19F